MTIRNTMKRLTAATVAIAALTVVGATSAQAAVSSPVVTKAIATMMVAGSDSYSAAYNACIQRETPSFEKALSKPSTRKAAMKTIAAKCESAANANTATTTTVVVQVVPAATRPANPASTQAAEQGNWMDSFDWSVPVDQIVRPEKACS